MDSYFVLAETEETEKNEKVLTASFYLAGKALSWYRTDKAKLTLINGVQKEDKKLSRVAPEYEFVDLIFV